MAIRGLSDPDGDRSWIRTIGSHLQLWRVDLDVAADMRRELGRLLSPAERGRASAFRFDRDRRRFEVARASLRLLLGRHLDVDPADVRIAPAPGGKPTLAGLDAAGTALSFNLSHAHDVGVICMSRTLRVGVDVERLRDVPEVAAIAERYLSPSEAQFVAGAEEPQRGARLLACWTRKEAVTKGVGEGLSMALDSFSVPVRSAVGPVKWADPSVGKWIVAGFALDDGYVAAVAARVAPAAGSAATRPREPDAGTDARLRHCESVDLSSILAAATPVRTQQPPMPPHAQPNNAP